ncbi:MAG TPA: nickel pincer cofactor biosynthesis protein LarC [Phycisphaerae bacterium]|nr:nickel pincer cofactor biosynthesis protein LarC [Phycisphaerae bacterium]
MRIAYFDCFSGAAGDMILGALLAAGLSQEALRNGLKKLAIGGYELDIRPVTKQGFAATKLDVKLTEKPGHRHLHHIVKIIDGSALSSFVKTESKRIFTRLAEAEARVHGTSIEKVHFHEVGAIDAIIDVVGTVIGLESLCIEQIFCSPLPLGSGTVKCEHGIMPVPAPATAELIKGFPTAPSEEVGELTTPTGAAILTTLARSFGPVPQMTINSIGYGAGTRDNKTCPNVLRVLIGESAASADTDQITVLETNVDDTTGQEIAHACELLFAAGALDVFTTPVFMKKNRPGVMITILAHADRAAACEEILFSQTRTLGIRRHTCSRTILQRRNETVSTPFGDIRVKIATRKGADVRVSPEYDDCAAAAKKANVPLRDVMAAAQDAWRKSTGGSP